LSGIDMPDLKQSHSKVPGRWVLHLKLEPKDSEVKNSSKNCVCFDGRVAIGSV